MLSTPRKRPASRSPEGGRHHKRQLTSSPEEGEVDDTPTVVSHPTILPIALPAKPVGGQTKKSVPFPFKKKVEATKEGADAKEGSQDAPPLNVFARFEEDARRAREEPHRNNHRPRPGMKNDHWEPSGPGRGPLRDSPPSLLSRLGPPSGASSAMSYPSRDDRDRDRDRDRRRSPRRSPGRSRSPTPHLSHYDRDRHRLPPARSPPPLSNFSPTIHAAMDKGRDHSRERGYDRDRNRDWDREWDRWDGDRRHNRRGSPPDHRYRPDYHRGEEREWTRRDNSYYPENRRRVDDRRDRRPGYDSYRPSSPRAPASSIPSVPSTLVSPPSLPAPPEPPRPPTPSISEPPPPPPLPPSPKLPSDNALKPPSDNAPRPPSSTPPPAPPPDVRLIKDVQLPPTHPQVKITLSRPPEAPRNVHSPLSLELPPAPTAKAMERGPQRKGPPPSLPLPPSKGFPPPHQNNNNQLGVPQKEPEPPRFRMLRRKLPLRRPPKVELKAYGHGFAGCGQQSDYEATTKVGEGTFGEVHKAVHKSTGKIVALKRILMHNEKEGMPVTALREIKILKALKHSCVVELLDMFVVRSTEKDPLSVYMVFPYMDHDLAGLLENERVKLQPSHIKLYMKQLLEGTEYMHRNNILHRDMKAANLLISNDGSLRIADFGLARSYNKNVAKGQSGDGSHRGRERKYTNCVVTRWYRPPELLMGARHYGGEVDIWGIGCVLGEMFTRKPILPGTSDLDQIEKIFFLCGAPNQHNWPNFDRLPGCEGVNRFNNHPRRLKPTYDILGPETVDLLDKLLIINPQERITASQALDHDYFWSDPLPADPKTMPSYEASHEFDKRGRHHVPVPVGPPMPPQQANNPPRYPQHPPPGSNAHFNNRGGGPPHKSGPPPPGYANHHDMHRRGGGPGGPGGKSGPGGPPMQGYPPPPMPPQQQQQQYPPYNNHNPHPSQNFHPHPPHPNGFRNGPPPPPHQGPPPPGAGGPFNHGRGGPQQQQPYPPRGQRPPPPPRQGDRHPPHPPRNYNNNLGPPPPHQGHPPPPPIQNRPSLPHNPNLPPRPIAPLGKVPTRENDSRPRDGGGRDNTDNNRRPLDTPNPPGGSGSAEGPPSGGLNYG